ncbi:saccharopine dehydrogenase family protein [Rhizobium sp. BR 314]|uniref:saccharopine dehydrogenase family protein n=1 Tax=Rhizobium sp. BR 314 TaxID=3040013 RepID=UPI0039BFD997
MRVLVLGGAGEMGRIAASEAASYSFVERVTVADVKYGAALAISQTIGARAEAAYCDVTDLSALRELMTAHDVVLNTVGPFYRFGLPILKAAIAAGKNYADICDDWEPTLEMLNLNAAARASGITAIMGIGASPGITNLLAMTTTSSLEQVDEILTGWSIDVDEQTHPEPERHSGSCDTLNAANVHWLQQLTGKIRQLQDGKLRDVSPLQRRDIRYPGLGAMSAWTVGHPEAVTLPRIFPELGSCANVMIGKDEDFKELKSLATLVDTGILSIERAARYLEEDSTPPKPTLVAPMPFRPQLFAWAKGIRDGRKIITSAHLRTLPSGTMGGATSIPLALTLPFFAVGFDGRSGVFTPEEILQPAAFFDELSRRCAGVSGHNKSLVVHAQEYLEP